MAQSGRSSPHPLARDSPGCSIDGVEPAGGCLCNVIELIARARVGVATKPTDGVHFQLVDVQVRRIEGVAADVEANDLPQDDFPGWPEFERHVTAAFKRRWR